MSDHMNAHLHPDGSIQYHAHASEAEGVRCAVPGCNNIVPRKGWVYCAKHQLSQALKKVVRFT